MEGRAMEGRAKEGRAKEGRAREVGENGAERVMAACSRPEGAVRGWPLGVTWVLGDPLESSPTGAVKEKDTGRGETGGQEAACPQLFLFLQEGRGWWL